MTENSWKWVVRICGLAGLAYETLVVSNPDRDLVLAFVAMIGLAEFFRRPNGNR